MGNATAQVQALPWCGRCIERTRMLIDADVQADGFIIERAPRRCPDCHTLAMDQGCGEHSHPPGHSCELCGNRIGSRRSHAGCRPEKNCYAGGKPWNPLPHEPLDLARATVRQMNEELKELREPRPPALLSVDHQGPAYQAALRDLARRQAAATAGKILWDREALIDWTNVPERRRPR